MHSQPYTNMAFPSSKYSLCTAFFFPFLCRMFLRTMKRYGDTAQLLSPSLDALKLPVVRESTILVAPLIPHGNLGFVTCVQSTGLSFTVVL